MSTTTEPISLVSHFPLTATEPFWQALQHHQRLRLQRCARCGAFRHYPRTLCHHCQEEQTELVEVSGNGELHTWTTVCRAFHPAFKAMVPYTVGLVDLAEGVRVMGHLSQLDSVTLRIGLPLRFAPVRIDEELWVPGFVRRPD